MALAKTRMIHWLQYKLNRSTLPALSGGLTLPANKQGLPTGDAIHSLAIPDRVCIPLTNYRRDILQPRVRVGDSVNRGDWLASGIVASCSGEVIGIESRTIIHPSGMKVPCVIIRTDSSTPDTSPVHPPLNTLTLERIEQCAIQGLGGAGFDTVEKLTTSDSLNTLIINAVECEPIICCDEALMMTHARSIVQAIHSIIDMSACRRCILAIESNKQDAVSAMKAELQTHLSASQVELCLLDPVYPSGAERPLIQRLTGRIIPAGSHPSQAGIVCINVATALAVDRARKGYPMTERVITIAGDRARQPLNVRVTFGTSVNEVLKLTGNLPVSDDTRVRAGGPLSGFDLTDLDAPVTATTNCITLEHRHDDVTSQPCIRCNACSDVCPVDLLPQQLHWFAQKEDHAGSQRYHLMDCIECGCCDAVCPSNIALTESFRYLKGLIIDDRRKQHLATEAQMRFQKREQRLAERVAAREQQRVDARAKLAGRSDPITDALSRIRKRGKPSTHQLSNTPDDSASTERDSKQDSKGSPL